MTDPSTCFVLDVDEPAAGQRLDRLVTERIGTAGLVLSRTRVKSLIEEGHVSLDGAVAGDAATRVKRGQVVSIEVPPAVDPVPRAEKMPLTILFEDEHLIVIDKRAGLVVHPAPGHGEGTLVNALIAHCGASLSGIGGVRRPGIVHRLDKDTSGVMVVAKTDAAHRGLAKLFADHGRRLSLERGYVAFVWGVPERAAGTIEARLGRHPTDRKKVAVVRDPHGREAITRWDVQERFSGPAGMPVASRLACQLETGRTHQIRVHLASLGHPLLGDPVYGGGFRTKSALLSPAARDDLAGLGRQALHANLLAFEHPVTRAPLHFDSPLPDDLATLQAALSQKPVQTTRAKP